MTTPLPDNVMQAPIKPLRHRWFARTPKPVFDEPTGNERHERVCEFCHVTRTTVIPPHGIPWIEWETAAGAKTIGGATPVCIPIAKGAAA